MRIQFGLLLVLAGYFQNITGQGHVFSVLTGKVEIEAVNEPISSVLKKIEKQTSLYFAYDSKTINTQKRISISFKEKTLSQAIFLLFNGTVLHKIKGNSIILYTSSSVNAYPGNKDITPAKKTVLIDSTTKPPVKNGILHSPDSKRFLDTSAYFADTTNMNSSNKDTFLIINEDPIVPKLRLMNDDTTILILEEEP